MHAVQINQISKYYNTNVGIKDVSLEIKKGEIFGFIGPNGAGKSTTIRVLLGLLIPNQGFVKIFGKDITTYGAEIRKKIGYLPAEVNYYDEMNSRELLRYHSKFHGDINDNEIERLADWFELDLEKEISDLSFGNKKKCAIIQSVIHKPELLILDEPTSGLDLLIQNRFFELIEKENKKGTTIFFSSHILSEIQRMCDRAAVIRKGEIVAIEDIQILLEKQMKKVRLIFKKTPNNINLPDGAQNKECYLNKLSFEYVGPTNNLLKWIAEQDLNDAILEEPDLESIFINYYNR